MSSVLTIVGARPQFIKAAVVSRALAAAGLDEQLVHTGQHYDVAMSSAFFDELDLPAPTHSLEIGSGRHGVQTGRMLAAIEDVITEQRPSIVMVYGDTNSTVAGSLAAAKLHVPVAHVEAGLRSFNRRMPEEINRVVTDHVSTILFAPSTVAAGHLAAEGIAGSHVQVVGDVMYDLALLSVERLGDRRGIVDDLGLRGVPFAVATVHRAENTDEAGRLEAIIAALETIATELAVVVPLHPRTRQTLRAAGRTVAPGVHLIEPVGYLDMADLQRSAAIVVTDSGGVQKEAFFHGTPCVTVRDETEWTELLELGWNTLAPPTSAAAISAAVLARIGTRGRAGQPYGDGHAADRIADALASAMEA